MGSLSYSLDPIAESFSESIADQEPECPALAPHPAMKSEYLGFLCTLRFTLTLGAGDHPYEWGGIFETPESNYMWTSQKVNAQYADPSLTMVAWPVTTFTEEALHALEEQAEAAMNMTCTDVQAGGTIVPASNTCFRLVFQEILAGGLRASEWFF